MIIVVEGLSAVGKTTLLQRMPAARIVAEAGAASNPGEGNPALASTGRETPRFWVDRQTHRWRQLLDIERRYGHAYADTDPIKLHYAFGLAMSGARPHDAFDEECAATWEAMTTELLGFADHVMLLSASPEVLAARKEADATRSRRNFALHARLGPSLNAYYATLERLRPGTVHYVDVGADTQPKDVRTMIQGFDATRQGRYDVELLCRFKHALDQALRKGA